MNAIAKLLFAATTILWSSLGAAAQAAEIPSGYPASYGKIVAASKDEGRLTVYSNMGAYNWKPIIDGFRKRYPWIEVETLDLGSSEVMTRYWAELGTGGKPGDLLVTASISDWIAYDEKKEAADYRSQEAAALPEWSRPFPGIYTISADPMVLVYNKMLLSEALRPDTLAGLAEAAVKHPEKFKGKIGTYTVKNAFGRSVNWAYVRERGDAAWRTLERLGTATKPGGGAGVMISKVAAGETVAAYFVSGIALFPKMDKTLGKVIDWHFPKDGTPVFLRGISVPRHASHPNAARLMLDFILSRDGQVAVGQGGLTPYRSDVSAKDVPYYTLPKIVKAVGEANIVLVNYDRAFVSGGEAFYQRWKKLYTVD